MRMVSWFIRCLFALEGALGRVATPPTTVAALRGRVVDTRLVVRLSVREDWSRRGGGGGGSRDDGGWRHLFLRG